MRRLFRSIFGQQVGMEAIKRYNLEKRALSHPLYLLPPDDFLQIRPWSPQPTTTSVRLPSRSPHMADQSNLTRTLFAI